MTEKAYDLIRNMRRFFLSAFDSPKCDMQLNRGLKHLCNLFFQNSNLQCLNQQLVNKHLAVHGSTL